jgi:hypothetical protein
MSLNRPDPGEVVLADWGREVHDATFFPMGTRVSGGTSNVVGTAFERLPLDIAVDDPGGWLVSDAIHVPTDGAGLYSFSLYVMTDNGDETQRTRVHLRVNGAGVLAFFVDQEGGIAVTDGRGGLVELAAGDVIEVWAAKTGGTNPDVKVYSFTLIRLGFAIGI